MKAYFLASSRTWSHARVRTGDLFPTKQMLYRLSYVGGPQLSNSRVGTTTPRTTTPKGHSPTDRRSSLAPSTRLANKSGSRTVATNAAPVVPTVAVLTTSSLNSDGVMVGDVGLLCWFIRNARGIKISTNSLSEPRGHIDSHGIADRVVSQSVELLRIVRRILGHRPADRKPLDSLALVRQEAPDSAVGVCDVRSAPIGASVPSRLRVEAIRYPLVDGP
jgi:hypothetical protein